MKQTIADMLQALEAVDELAYIADDAGQADIETGTMPVRMPAALVGLSTSTNDSVIKDRTREQALMSVRLLDAPSTIANSKAPQAHKDSSLKIYDIRNAIIRQMKLPGLRYYTTTRIPRQDGIRELQLLFRCKIEIE